MNGAHLPDTLGSQAFKGSYPEIKVRIDRVLYQNRDVGIAERFGNLLDQEGIGGCTSPQPNHVDAMLQTLIYVLLACDLCADTHAEFFFYTAHPAKPGHTGAFEASRVRTGFPYPRPEHVNTYLFQPSGSFHNLFFALCTAGSGYYARTRRQVEKAPVVQRHQIKFHRIILFILFPSSMSSRILVSS